MSRNLGYFTSYGIEYVYDYLGEKRVDQRIEELKEKPTMGVRLEKFTYGDLENSYFDCTGVLYIFTMIIHSWFSDLDFLYFLITNSKKYNKDNYLEGGIIQKKWTDHLAWMDEMIQRSPDKRDYYLSRKINPYWMDLHFFYMQIFKKIEKEDFNKAKLELDLTGSYEFYKDKLSGKFELEIKTRRKPFTGAYLLYRKDLQWYNLEPISLDESVKKYQFTKGKNVYRVIVDLKESKAKIDLIESNSCGVEYLSILNRNDLNDSLTEMFEYYLKNFKEISLRMKQEIHTLTPGQVLSNGCMWKICDYYKSKGNYQKANDVAKLNNSFDVWRNIPEDEEEYIEED